jgi:hypothetical protein
VAIRAFRMLGYLYWDLPFGFSFKTSVGISVIFARFILLHRYIDLQIRSWFCMANEGD